MFVHQKVFGKETHYPLIFSFFSAEGLSNLLKQARAKNEISGFSIAKRGPIVTHLFFANDSLVFCKVNVGDAEQIRNILKKYEAASGQMINLVKSLMMFSKNAKQESKEVICSILNNIQCVESGKYLGLPLVIGRSKNSVFRFIKDRLTSKVQSWKGKLLNNAGKEVLLKLEALALPSYAMSVFKLSTQLNKELSSIMAKFWWSNDQGEKKMHWKKW